MAVLNVVVAAAAIVAVMTTFSAATQGLYEESNKFGANIIVKPEVKTIPLVAGSTSIGSLSTGENYIEESEISKIYTIKNNANLAVVAPRLYGIAKIGNSSVVIMGVDPDKEKKLKSWWNIQGHWMTAGSDPNKTEVIVGSDIAGPLGIKEGSQITLSQGNISINTLVTGVIERTGGNEDGYIILPLAASQYCYLKKEKVSSLEVKHYVTIVLLKK